MKFRLILEDLLNELSGEEIYTKYYSKIPYNEFIEIVKSDPQSSVGEDNKVNRIGKYGKLFILMFQKGGLKLEDLDKVKEYIGYVYAHKIPLDVNKINELGDLYNIVKDFIAKDTKDLTEILKILGKEEFKVLYNGENWYIFQPLTEKASCYLGVNTEWCTTWGPYSLNDKHRERGSMYQRYSKDGPLYILINKKDLNDKYQFHFESKQYMDRNDRRANSGTLLEENPELLKYFFPSFYNEVSDEELKKEISRSEILPDTLSTDLIKKSLGQITNELVMAILNDDEEVVNQLIKSTDIDDSITIGRGRINISVEDFKEDAQSLYDTYNSMEWDAENGSEFIYDDIRERGNDDENEFFTNFLEKYYEENSEDLLNNLGINDFESFTESFLSEYSEDDKIKEAYWSDVADLSRESFESMAQTSIDEVDEVIKFNYREMSINVAQFVSFLVKNNINEINDEKNFEFWDTIDKFINSKGLPLEYERHYDYAETNPTYGDGNDLSRQTDKFFEEKMSNPDTTKDCVVLRKKLNEIIKKYFKYDYGKWQYENDQVKIHLKSQKVNCDTGMVQVEYTNKQTGETYGGWRQSDGVKIENLISLMTNYKLFESIVRFRKNIK